MWEHGRPVRDQELGEAEEPRCGGLQQEQGQVRRPFEEGVQV